MVRSPWIGGGTRLVPRPLPARYPKSMTQAVQNRIMTLAGQIDAMPPDDPGRPAAIRAVQGLIANNDPTASPYDIACLPQTGSDPRGADIPLLWHREDINDEGMKVAGLCQGITDEATLDDCHKKNYGFVVMVVEPEIAGLCRGAGGPEHDIDKMAQCAENTFNAHAADGFIPAPSPGTWMANSLSCNPAGGGDPKQQRQSLRDKIRAQIEAARRRAANGDDDDDDGGNGNTPGAVTAAASPTETPQPAPPRDENEAYCNYMASQVVRGELTFGGGSKIPAECKAVIAAAEAIAARQKAQGYQPFSMSGSDTDAQIKRYLDEFEEWQQAD